jgi:prepilin-type N-terminal cleavage/methylation domain-containing protein
MPFSRADAEVEVTCPWRDGRCPVPNIRDATAGVPPKSGISGFTLIELLVVILIVAVLMGLAFPVFQGVQNSAKKTQAKNDLVQIVTAVNAFYTEYGRYPLPASATSDATATYGSSNSNRTLFDELRGIAGTTLNTRQIVFLSPPDAKDPTKPRSGIAAATSANAGQYFDPWGTAYAIRIDWNYDNEVPNPYSANAGATPNLRNGVIAWSFGKDTLSGSLPGPASDKNTGTSKDDVISWQ